MSATITATGRLAGDPVSRLAKTGSAYVTARIAVNSVSPESPSLWLNVIAFAEAGTALADYTKGELVTLSGRLELQKWHTAAGQERESFRVTAETVGSKSSRLPKKRTPDAKKPSAKKPEPATTPLQDDLDDALPW